MERDDRRPTQPNVLSDRLESRARSGSSAIDYDDVWIELAGASEPPALTVCDYDERSEGAHLLRDNVGAGRVVVDPYQTKAREDVKRLMTCGPEGQKERIELRVVIIHAVDEWTSFGHEVGDGRGDLRWRTEMKAGLCGSRSCRGVGEGLRENGRQLEHGGFSELRRGRSARLCKRCDFRSKGIHTRAPRDHGCCALRKRVESLRERRFIEQEGCGHVLGERDDCVAGSIARGAAHEDQERRRCAMECVVQLARRNVLRAHAPAVKRETNRMLERLTPTDKHDVDMFAFRRGRRVFDTDAIHDPDSRSFDRCRVVLSCKKRLFTHVGGSILARDPDPGEFSTDCPA